mgnify:CR=1 FL=1
MNRRQTKPRQDHIALNVLYHKFNIKKIKTHYLTQFRCYRCDSCIQQDCLTCITCKNKISYGGSGTMKLACQYKKQCISPILKFKLIIK